MSYNIVSCCHRLRTPRGQSLGSLGNYLYGDSQDIRAARGGRKGCEQRTTTGPVQCCGGGAVGRAREVGERRERGDFARTERGDRLILCTNESGEHESKGRGSQQDHDRRVKGGWPTGRRLYAGTHLGWTNSHSARMPKKQRHEVALEPNMTGIAHQRVVLK